MPNILAQWIPLFCLVEEVLAELDDQLCMGLLSVMVAVYYTGTYVVINYYVK